MQMNDIGVFADNTKEWMMGVLVYVKHWVERCVRSFQYRVHCFHMTDTSCLHTWHERERCFE